MPTDPNLDAILQGLLGGVDVGLGQIQERKSPEMLSMLLRVRNEQEEIKMAKQRLKLLEDTNKLQTKEYWNTLATEEQKRRQAEEADRAQRKALENMRATGPVGQRLADMITAQGGGQISGRAMEEYLGVKPEVPVTPLQANYEFAKRNGYQGSIEDFVRMFEGEPGGRRPTKTMQQRAQEIYSDLLEAERKKQAGEYAGQTVTPPAKLQRQANIQAMREFGVPQRIGAEARKRVKEDIAMQKLQRVETLLSQGKDLDEQITNLQNQVARLRRELAGGPGAQRQ